MEIERRKGKESKQSGGMLVDGEYVAILPGAHHTRRNGKWARRRVPENLDHREGWSGSVHPRRSLGAEPQRSLRRRVLGCSTSMGNAMTEESEILVPDYDDPKELWAYFGLAFYRANAPRAWSA